MLSRRSDIQGLRAIAVMAVIAFHFNLGFPGGFLGVDMFFVISGYVIGGVLLREFGADGKINWLSFFRKRFFRLAPALSVVTLTTLFLQYFFFTYPEIRETSEKSGLSAQVGISNFFIALESNDYFGLSASRNPFLHTWSLSVEWQFYAILALLLSGTIAAHRLTRSTFGPILVGIWIASFVASFAQIQIGDFDLSGFYSPLSRTWEFISGVLVVYLTTSNTLSGRRRSLVVLVGAFGVCAGILAPPGGQLAQSVTQVLVTLGTALIIWGGAQENGLVSRALGSKPAVWIGDRSYSLYLWHWPVFVMWVQYGLTKYPEGPWLLLLVSITVFLSWFSFKYVEEKFRSAWREGALFPRGFVVSLWLLPFLLAGTWSALGENYDKFTQTTGLVSVPKSGEVGQKPFFLALEHAFYDCQEPFAAQQAPKWDGFIRCKQSQRSGDVDVAILGDSHAEHLFPGVAQEFPNKNVAYYIDGALPVFGETERMDSLIQGIRNNDSVDYVIVSARWEGRGIPREKIARVIRELVESGKEIILTDDIPIALETPSHCKFSSSLFSYETFCESGPGTGLSRATIDSELAKLASDNDASLISTYPIFCPNGTCSIASSSGTKVLYRDYDHLNFEGSAQVARVVAAEIRK